MTTKAGEPSEPSEPGRVAMDMAKRHVGETPATIKKRVRTQMERWTSMSAAEIDEGIDSLYGKLDHIWKGDATSIAAEGEPPYIKEGTPAPDASIATVAGVATAAIDSWQKDGKKYAKFFLMSADQNLNLWQVPIDTIPKYLPTFIGQPLTEEPNGEHFGAENMETHQIVTAQEDYRVGTIIEVDWNQATKIGTAIVEIHEDDLWERIKAGEAIHVSPAITGMAKEYSDGSKVYSEWHGLHLARVDNPAYGVMHANLQKTCEGDERECVRRLTSTAATKNISFNPLGLSKCQLAMEHDNKDDKDSKDEKGTAALAAAITTLNASIADFKNSIAMDEDDPKKDDGMGMDNDNEPKDDNDTANKSVGVPDKLKGSEKQSPSVSALQKEVASLKKAAVAMEEEKKNDMADDIMKLMKDDDMGMDDDEEMKKDLMAQSTAALASQLKTAQAYHEKIAISNASGLASTDRRVVSLASASKNRVSHDEMKELMP